MIDLQPKENSYEISDNLSIAGRRLRRAGGAAVVARPVVRPAAPCCCCRTAGGRCSPQGVLTIPRRISLETRRVTSD